MLQERQLGDQGHCLYSRCYISGRDIAAFFTDCGCDSQNCALVSPTSNSILSISPMLEDADKLCSLIDLLEDADKLCSLIDRCGMAVIVDQVYFNLYIPVYMLSKD